MYYTHRETGLTYKKVESKRGYIVAHRVPDNRREEIPEEYLVVEKNPLTLFTTIADDEADKRVSKFRQAVADKINFKILPVRDDLKYVLVRTSEHSIARKLMVEFYAKNGY